MKGLKWAFLKCLMGCINLLEIYLTLLDIFFNIFSIFSKVRSGFKNLWCGAVGYVLISGLAWLVAENFLDVANWSDRQKFSASVKKLFLL
jgi:hypothetical protein